MTHIKKGSFKIISRFVIASQRRSNLKRRDSSLTLGMTGIVEGNNV